ncbi:MAG: transposase [Methylocella sp.]
MKSQISRLREAIDEKVKAFLDRPLQGDWPYVWIDATYVKVRQNGRIVPVAAIIAIGANADGRREVLGMAVGPSEAATPEPAEGGGLLAQARQARPTRGEARRLRRP